MYPWTRDELLMTRYFNKAAIASNLVLGERGGLGRGESSLESPSPWETFLTSSRFILKENFTFKIISEVAKSYSEPRIINKMRDQTG